MSGFGLEAALDVAGGGDSDWRAESVPGACDGEDRADDCFEGTRRGDLTDAGDWSTLAMGVASSPCRKRA